MKMNHLIVAAALAALASGSAFAQTAGASNMGDSVTSGLTKGKDDANDAKQSGQSTAKSKKDAKGTQANPITVTPPSQEDPNTTVNVNTDPAKANATAGPSGANADADINATTTAPNGKSAKPGSKVTEKLDQTKEDVKKRKDEISKQ
jgi:hypothetical protein